MICKVISSIVARTILVLVSSATLFSITFSQANDAPTETEKKVARALAAQFETKLDDMGSIEPVAKEMLPPDFVRLLINAERDRLELSGLASREDMLFVPGIDYSSKLLDDATEDDWRQFYIATFDIFQYPANRMMNRMVEAMLEAKRKGKKTEDVEDSFSNIKSSDLFSKEVISLFDKHPILKNFILKKGNGRPIATVAEMRSVNSTLQQALAMLQKNQAKDIKLSPDARKFIAHFTDADLGEDEIGPWLSIGDGEFGLPKGARVITIFSSAQHELTIAKIGSDYKILRARISSPG